MRDADRPAPAPLTFSRPISSTIPAILFCLAALFAYAGPAHAQGIVAKGPPVRLKTHRVDARIDGRIARVAVEQTFANTGPTEQEGVYLFALPRDAVVGELSLTVGDKTLEGEVLDAAHARAIYRAIVRKKRDPAMLEYVGRGLFRARVYPIPARGEVTVRLTYREVLRDDAGSAAWRYPLATDGLNHTPTDVAIVNVIVTGERELRTLRSPSHKIAVTRKDARTAVAKCAVENFRHKADFVLLLGRGGGDIAFTLASGKPSGRAGTFFAVLSPRTVWADTKVAPRDIVYVLDTSGSMNGGKLEQAKRALQQGITMLREEDRFNVIEFATDVRPFRRELIAATPANKKAAATWIAARVAGGSTALADAIDTSLALTKADEERLSMVVLLTDGRPTVGERDGNVILKRALQANRGGARVFTFGVGSDLDVRLLDRLAEKTRGVREYVGAHERIDSVVARFFQSVDQPVLTGLTLETSEGVEGVYPRPLRDLFAGGEIVLLGRYAKPGPIELTLRGMRGKEKVTYVFRGTLSGRDDDTGLERIWAQRKVAYLLDHVRLHGANAELVTEIRALAIRHAFVTPYTAHLAAEGGGTGVSSGPLHFASRKGGRGGGGGHGGAFRGPNGGIPPNLRDPSDPMPPPPPPSAPSGPTTPGMPRDSVSASKSLKKAKDSARAETHMHVRTIGSRVYHYTTKKRWVDAAWDGKKKPTCIETFSDEYFDLLDKHPKLARVLALGTHVVFVLDGVVYEVKPAS